MPHDLPHPSSRQTRDRGSPGASSTRCGHTPHHLGREPSHVEALRRRRLQPRHVLVEPRRPGEVDDGVEGGGHQRTIFQSPLMRAT